MLCKHGMLVVDCVVVVVLVLRLVLDLVSVLIVLCHVVLCRAADQRRAMGVREAVPETVFIRKNLRRCVRNAAGCF